MVKRTEVVAATQIAWYRNARAIAHVIHGQSLLHSTLSLNASFWMKRIV